MTAFWHIQALTAYLSLPFSHTFAFDEVDPQNPSYLQPLDLAGRTVTAQLRGRPKVKVLQIVVVDPPTPGLYQFTITLGGVVYPFEFEIEDGASAQDWVKAFMAAIKALGLDLTVCAETCGAAGELILAGIWPGQVWELAIVSQPGVDEIEIDQLQGPDTLLATFTVATGTSTDGQKTTIKISLTGTQTSGLPMAGDGPYSYRVLAVDDLDATDVLFLARGHLLIGWV